MGLLGLITIFVLALIGTKVMTPKSDVECAVLLGGELVATFGSGTKVPGEALVIDEYWLKLKVVEPEQVAVNVVDGLIFPVKTFEDWLNCG
ncbi:MAG: hypothetical protein V4651_14720, partial [Bacteroidota bacterium]